MSFHLLKTGCLSKTSAPDQTPSCPVANPPPDRVLFSEASRWGLAQSDGVRGAERVRALWSGVWADKLREKTRGSAVMVCVKGRRVCTPRALGSEQAMCQPALRAGSGGRGRRGLPVGLTSQEQGCVEESDLF